MSIETYEKQLAMTELYRKLHEAEMQVAKGVPLFDGEEVFAKIRDKYVK